MPPITGNCLCWRLQLFALRFGAEISTPEFWFGEFVDFCWKDEITGQPHSETGVIVGVIWNQVEREWQYVVAWLSSTVEYGDDHYPIFSQEFVPGEVLCRI